MVPDKPRRIIPPAPNTVGSWRGVAENGGGIGVAGVDEAREEDGVWWLMEGEEEEKERTEESTAVGGGGRPGRWVLMTQRPGRGTGARLRCGGQR